LQRSLRTWLLVCAGGISLLRYLASWRVPPISSLVWLLTTALMADWHLGMIPSPRNPAPTRLGLANRISLLRAMLPAAILGVPAQRPRLRAGVGLVALITDLADGLIARRTRTVTHFGVVADPLADAVVWPALAATARRDAMGHTLARVTLVRYLFPLIVSLFVTFARGRTFDWYPSRLGKWSSALLAVVLAWREFRSA
jgi:phosphatidylglycerophosphate synthase